MRRMAAFEPLPFSIEVVGSESGAVLSLGGELDLATAPELESALLGRLAAGETVTVDLRELQFMDSSGVRVLVAAHTTARDGAGTLLVVRPQPGGEVDRVLEVSGVAAALAMVDEP